MRALEDNVDNEGLAWVISEGSKDSIRVTRVIFWIRNPVADQPRLKKQLDYRETSPAEVKPSVLYWDNRCWSSGAEESAVISKRSASLM